MGMPDGIARGLRSGVPWSTGDAFASDLEEVLTGLAQPQKTLPAKLFYDDEGCRLFGEITRLPEYYPTRTERALLEAIATHLPRRPGCALVEYGASDEAKAELIFDAVGATTYVPIDIAEPALMALQARLGRSRPSLRVCPVAADFLRPAALPKAVMGQPATGFFPGSTIGNLTPEVAAAFLVQVRQQLGHNAAMLIGVDLQKPLETLLPAYNDAQGVTAAFNRNILSHVNDAFGADFDPAQFSHHALWNQQEGRIEMHLSSRQAQVVSIADLRIAFARGETIHTENSYKYSVAGFQALARRSGWQTAQVWTDTDHLFSLHLLTA